MISTNLERERQNRSCLKKMKPPAFAWGLGAALAVAAFAAPGAFAQGMGPAMPAPATAPVKPAPAMAPAKPHALPDQKIEAHITELHKQLGITPEQEDKWKPVADEMRDDAGTVSDLIRTRESSLDTMTAVDDLKSYQQIADAHSDSLKKLIPLFSTLYDSMSDAQKKVADAAFSHGPGHSKHG